MRELSLGLGIVSWRSHDTLRATLEAHRVVVLPDVVDQAIIWFQDLSERNFTIAAEFGYQSAGGPDCGIAEGMAGIAETLQTDLVLFLENDCPAHQTRVLSRPHDGLVCTHPSRRTSNGFQSPETPLNCPWWRRQRFRIGVGRGLFTHRRLYGSWRPSHAAYQADTSPV